MKFKSKADNKRQKWQVPLNTYPSAKYHRSMYQNLQDILKVTQPWNLGQGQVTSQNLSSMHQDPSLYQMSMV